MGPVPPVSVGSSGASLASRPIADYTSAARGVGAGGLGLGSLQASTLTSSVAQVSAAVGELLKAIGGGVENDQALRMLVVLFILMALLEKPQVHDGAANAALQQLGNTGNAGTRFVSLSSSSTTIEIQQSSTTVVYGSVEGQSAPSKTGVSPPGGEIDVLS